MDKKSKLLEELDEVTLRSIKKINEFKVEASFRKGKVCSFLEDLIALCSKHNVYIRTDPDTECTAIEFYNWDGFAALEVDSEAASLYWPRIQTDIVVRRKNEQRKSKEDC